MAQAFRTQNLRLLGNLFDKNNSLGAKGYYLHSTGDGTAWQADQNEESGILTGGILTIGTGSTISVSAGTGQIYTRSVVSSEIVTTLTNVSWSAFTNVSLTYLATKQFTYLYIDQFGALVQSDTVFSDSVFKDYIVIGIVVHLNSSTVNAVINSQNAGYGDSHRLYELYNSFGPIKRAGLTLSSNGANLKINRGSGSVLLIGCNYPTDQFEPDIATITSYTDVKFARVRANGSGGFTFDSNSGSLYTAIDPNNYDDGTGTLASVTAGYWTIQRFYLFPNITDRLVNYYGVATYTTLADALTALPNENFNESPFTARDTVFLGYVIVKQGVTDLSSSSNAKFVQGGLSRSLSSSSASGGGSAVGSLDDLSDVQITTPLGGQFLTYDSSVSLWKNRSFILDANNNELIKFPSSVASAVNEITISNAATTGSPSISATGDDTNIGLNLIPKGTGLVQINGKAISLANSFTTSGNFALTFTTTGTTSLTLPTSGTLATTSQIPTVNNNTLTLAGSGGIGVGTSPTFTANASVDKTITISIADGALNIAKLENIATSRILGRTSASTGAVEILDGSGVASVIGTNAVARATNLAAGIAGQIPYQSGANTTAFTAAGTASQVLLSGGSGAPTWANQSSLSVGTSNSVANALTIASPLTGTSYNGSSAVTIGLQNATASLAGGVSTSAQTFGGDKTFANNVIVTGDLTVNGTTVTVNTTTLAVKDKNIELGLVSVPSDTTADGGGITLKGTTDKTFNWVNATSSWTSSENLDLVTGKTYRINNVAVLSATTLGSSVVNSSLTSVGTLTNLTVTNTITGSVSGSAGSLSGTYTFWGQSFNGTQNVSGNLTSVGNITGSSGITITAGGSNQNVVLTPSGTGYTLLNGSVGIGNSTPNNKLTIQAGDNKDSGPIINLGGNAINQFESGRIRFTEVVTGATPFYEGAYLHYDGSNNLFHIGVHNTSDALIANDVNAISIIRSSANVGVGTTSVLSKFVVNGGTVNTSTYTSSESRIADGSLHLMKTVAGGIFESIRAMNADTTAGTTVRFIAASTSDPFNNTNGGKVFIDAIRSATNMDLAFSLNDIAGAAPVERVRFMGSGNVGIGTTNAIYALDVYKDINAGHIQAIRNINSGSSAYAALFIGNDQGANKIVMFSNSSARTGDGGVGNSTIRTDSGNLYLGASASQHILSTTGNVGIGITSTPNNKLHIAGSASIGSNYNIAAPTNGLIVEGNVGIGVSSLNADAKLHVVGNADIGDSTDDTGIIIRHGSGAAQYGRIRFYSTSTNISTIHSFPTLWNNGTFLTTSSGAINLQGGNGITFGSWNNIDAAFAQGGNNYFKGNVGIGTVTPAYKLDVSGRISYNGAIGEGADATLSSSGTVLLHGNSSTWTEQRFYTVGVQRVTINTSGNVGIGTTSASKTLDIRGAGGVLNLQSTSNDVWQTFTPQTGNVWRLQAQTGNTFGVYDEAASAFRLLINSNGNLGVNITSQTYKVEIYSGSKVSAFTGLAISNFNNYDGTAASLVTSQLRFAILENPITTYNSSTRTFAILESGNEANNSSSDGFFAISTRLSGAVAEKVRVNSAGNVGIGTTIPSNKLDVNGDIRVRSISASASTATIFLTTDANGVLISRTAAQVRSDIGAGTGSGTVTSVTGTAPIASSGGTTPAISLNDAGVTFAKIQNLSSGAVIGRTAAGTGVSSEIDGAGIASIISTNAVTNSTNAANVTIATDDTTNSSYYLYFGANASGNTPIKASTKIRYNPSTGAFSATTKSFRIPHPTKPEHDLVYGSLESPYHGIRLTGKGKTNGICAEIILPDYANTLIDENTVNIQITSYKCAKVFYIENINIKDNKFIVKYDKSWYEKAKDVEFFWDFTAERKDVPKLIVEEKL
jgi:hypothetical protein